MPNKQYKQTTNKETNPKRKTKKKYPQQIFGVLDSSMLCKLFLLDLSTAINL